jgi:hypothetical protein
MTQLLQHPDAAQSLREEGRKEEALRLARIAVSNRPGGLEDSTSLAFERLDTSALENIIFDHTLTNDRLRTRLLASPKDRKKASVPTRISPFGGYRNS